MEIKTNICMKRDSLENWVDHNPVLRDGELAVVWLDPWTVKLKVGDGERSFIDLPYITF